MTARAVERRRREFATARLCARQALAVLGHPPGPVLPGRRGAPRWPLGVAGSITHCAGYWAAAVAWRRDIRSIGIDAEPAGPLPAGVLRLLAGPEETGHMAELAREGGGPRHWERLLFTCKESIFKAWYPITARELDFFQVSMRFDLRTQTFDSRILVDRRPWTGVVPSRLTGRWATDGALVASAVVLAG